VISVFFLSQTIWPSESVCPLNGIPKCVGAQFAPPHRDKLLPALSSTLWSRFPHL
jgi:hypothetical protein